MIYIIPKQFNDNWERILAFIERLNNLDITYNPKKNLYPRLKNTTKRGRISSQEIMNSLGCYMISKKDWLEELCYCLKYNFEIQENNGKRLLITNNENIEKDVDNIYFKNHIFCNDEEVEDIIINIIQSQNIKDIFINPVEYLKGHIDNMELNSHQKLELIKFILN